MELLGPKIRRHRRRLGLTLDELAGRTSISKPYLSLIETGRVANPPSDDKLRRLEQTLGFVAGELLTQAHLHRTPRDVRAVLHQLMEGSGEGLGVGVQGSGKKETAAQASGASASSLNPEPRTPNPSANPEPRTPNPSPSPGADAAYLSGVWQELAGSMERITVNAVPVINRVSAGYPRDFSDLNYPPRVADEYLSCPDVTDRQAFAARVHGDSMTPKYREGDIVIFSPALCARDGDDCFIRFADGQTSFKRVFFETSETQKATLRLQPRNERHRPQTVPSEQVAGLYKAVYRYQRLDE